MIKELNLIGVYTVESEPDVHLLEFNIKAKHTEIDFGEFTQRQEGVPKDDWQVAYDERYLNEDGTEESDETSDTTRFTFFLYHIDFSQPLLTPFGDITLPAPTPMPERLSAIIEFEDPEGDFDDEEIS